MVHIIEINTENDFKLVVSKSCIYIPNLESYFIITEDDVDTTLISLSFEVSLYSLIKAWYTNNMPNYIENGNYYIKITQIDTDDINKVIESVNLLIDVF